MDEKYNGYKFIKTIYIVILIFMILFGFVGNYYLYSYRLSQAEEVAKNNRKRVDSLEKNLIEINIKLDLLLEKNGILQKNVRLRGAK